MLAEAALVAASCLAGGALWGVAKRERTAEMHWRAHLLDEAATLVPSGRIAIGPDGFPRFSAPRAGGGRIEIDLVADTLVTRRLPQLWLKLTLRDDRPVRDFALGALARPTGAEFFALTHGLPDWIEPPAGDVPLLLRGRNVPEERRAGSVAMLAGMFADPALKEAATTPRGVRVVRQVAQGERGAHLLLRQARFPMDVVGASALRAALRDAERLGAALRTQGAFLDRAA